MFQKYPKILSSKKEAYDLYTKAVNFGNIPKGTTFEVSQKIHGSNVSVIVSSNGTIKTARRNAILSPCDTFFGVQKWLPEYLNWSRLAELFPKASYVQVYGEIFGGGRNGNSIEKCKTKHNDLDNAYINPVQKNVFYTEKYHFQVFDIIVHYDTSDIHESFVVSPGDMRHIIHKLYIEKINLCGNPGWDALPYASKMFGGTFEQCVEFALKNIESPWYSHITHSYPTPDKPNEGFVIRPSAGYYIEQLKQANADCNMYPTKNNYVSKQKMILLKMKSKSFTEKNVHRQSTPSVVYDSHVVNIVKDMCTNGRIESVLSKMLEHERNIQNISKICTEVISDIINDSEHICIENKSNTYKFVRKVCFDKLRNYFLKV